MNNIADTHDELRRKQSDLRRRIGDILARMSREEHAARSALVQRHLLGMPEYTAARRLMLYISMPDEVNTRPIINAAIAAGKLVYAPKVEHHPRRLLICRLRDMGKLRTGALGIPEPPTSEVLNPAQLDLVVIPGRVFDSHGNRIGRGGGYYDRFLLSPALRAVRVGLAFDCQFCDFVPHHLADYPIRFVVTESGVMGRTPISRGVFPGDALRSP